MRRTDDTGRARYRRAMAALGALTVLLAAASIVCGTVDLSLGQIWGALTGEGDDAVAATIVREVRVPMALTAFFAGVGLSVAGLLLQTTFNNPLAGPSILGVSTGASLGVAVVMLAAGGWIGSTTGYYAGILGGAFTGAAAVMAVLLVFSTAVRNNAMLLIIGVLIGYLASSAISLLNFFSTQQGVHSYVIWGMGTFGGLTWERLWVMGGLTTALTAGAALFVKPLNALLLGRRYAESLGVRVVWVRNWLLVISGALTAVVAAFCGPIGFLGLVMPHVARMLTGSSHHGRLLPATVLAGGCGSLLCGWLSVACGGGQIIPVNAITPVISVPIIIYVIVKGRRR